MVKTISEQPCVIHYRLAGNVYRHVPDSLVVTNDGPTFWEIKTADDARRPAIAARTRLLAAECPRFGYQYCVALAEDLRRQPRLRNACFVLRHGRQPLAFEQREGCRQLLAVVTSFRWVDVVANLYAPLTLAAACHLILEGAMCMDFDKAFDEQFLVVARAAHMETNHE
ncbi:MAG TPA: hypothetical protein PLA97_04965 [Rubrivivax sp.]|nr:hypothetical protein [Rubrivivax sp.]